MSPLRSNVSRQTSFLNTLPPPEPMDTTSGHTKNRPNFQNRANNKYIQQELFNTEECVEENTSNDCTEFQDLDHYTPESMQEPQSIIDDENFQITASKNPPDI